MAQGPFLSDREFLQLQKGSDAVFRKVYTAYYSLVQYVIFRCGIDHEEKRDLIQETFLRLHVNVHEIRDPLAIKAWLVTCARNLSLDFLRSKKMLPLDAEKIGSLVDTRAEELQDALHRELEIRLVSRLILEVCAQAGDDTFKLFYMDGLKAREIAELRGEAVSTVTTRISRLRQKFQQVFSQHLAELEKGAGERDGPHE